MDSAEAQIIEDAVSEIIGFTPDEQTFLYLSDQVWSESDGESSSTVAYAVFGRALSREGDAGRWLRSFEGSEAYRPASDDFRAFAALAKSASRHHDERSGPFGAVSLYLDGYPIPLAQGRLFAAARDEEIPSADIEPDPRIAVVDRRGEGRSSASLTLRRCAQRERLVLETGWTQTPYTGDPAPGQIWTIWSPSGAWLAAVVSVSPYHHMRSGTLAHTGAIAIVPTGYETQILAPSGFPEASVSALQQQWTPDYVVTSTGVAQKARARSVVYYAQGQQQSAEDLAARIPGGASTEPLTWEVREACLVVALGESAR